MTWNSPGRMTASCSVSPHVSLYPGKNTLAFYLLFNLLAHIILNESTHMQLYIPPCLLSMPWYILKYGFNLSSCKKPADSSSALSCVVSGAVSRWDLVVCGCLGDKIKVVPRGVCCVVTDRYSPFSYLSRWALSGVGPPTSHVFPGCSELNAVMKTCTKEWWSTL